VLDAGGEVTLRQTVVNTKESVVRFFKKYKGALVAMEVGTHSPWIARDLEALGGAIGDASRHSTIVLT